MIITFPTSMNFQVDLYFCWWTVRWFMPQFFLARCLACISVILCQ